MNWRYKRGGPRAKLKLCSIKKPQLLRHVWKCPGGCFQGYAWNRCLCHFCQGQRILIPFDSPKINQKRSQDTHELQELRFDTPSLGSVLGLWFLLRDVWCKLPCWLKFGAWGENAEPVALAHGDEDMTCSLCRKKTGCHIDSAWSRLRRTALAISSIPTSMPLVAFWLAILAHLHGSWLNAEAIRYNVSLFAIIGWLKHELKKSSNMTLHQRSGLIFLCKVQVQNHVFTRSVVGTW